RAPLAGGEVGLAHHTLSRPGGIHARAALEHGTGDLVAHRHRWFVAVLVRGDVQVGTAHPGGVHLEPHLTGLERPGLALGDLDRARTRAGLRQPDQCTAPAGNAPRDSIRAATRSGDRPNRSSRKSLGADSDQVSSRPIRVTRLPRPAPATASATSPPSPPTTECSSTVTISLASPTASSTVASESGLRKAACRWRAWIPRSASRSSAAAVRAVC